MKLTELYRYPVKGLPAESLNEVTLVKEKALPHDRTFAITHGTSKFDLNQPTWISRRNFVVVAYSPKINTLKVRLDNSDNKIIIEDTHSLLAEFDSTQTNLPTIDLNNHVTDLQHGPHQIVTVPNISLTDSPIQAVSIMSHRSLESLSDSVGKPLSPNRFRGNLWIDGDFPWSEFDWLGSELQLGNTRLKVIDKIRRCAAINANPETGKCDLDILTPLTTTVGQSDFGVLAVVLEGGTLKVGDTVNKLPL